MKEHDFLKKSQSWIGEGNISLNMVEENLTFYTKWKVLSADSLGKVQAMQEIQVEGIAESMKNELTFYDFTDKGFSVEMENLNIGRVVGRGVIDSKVVAWEFRDNDLNFEGFETYYLQDDGSYLLHAEYVTSDQFRTQLEGRIWLPPAIGNNDLKT